jgi:hypothetical protein
MMKYILTLLILLVPTSLYAEDGASKFEAFLKSLLTEKTVTQHVESNKTPAPYFAEKYLRGDAWAAWAIEHNLVERQRARENADPGTEVHVQIGNPYYPPLSYVPYPSYNGVQTYKSYSYRYGASSGPVMLYNPYVSPK